MRRVALGALVVLLALGLTRTTRAQTGRQPNDPLYARQSYLLAIHAPEAWTITIGDPGVIIAVVDSGIDLTHPDLAPNLRANPNAGLAGCGDDAHGCDVLDPARAARSCGQLPAAPSADVAPLTPRGTFLAGIVAAVGNNGQGIAGVMWQATIIAVRAADCRGSTDEQTLAAGIAYAVRAGARVILVGSMAKRTAANGCAPPRSALAQAVQAARDAGVLVIAGAGDENASCVDDPAAAPGSLAVAGATLDGRRWVERKDGSNAGPQIAVAAPAAELLSTIPLQARRKPPDDRYAISSSTAYAAALVAGEAGLLLAANAALTPDWLTTLIVRSAHPLPDGDAPGWAGAGLIDVAGALRLVPAALRGTVTVDGTPAPDGTLIEAYVQGHSCGQAATFFDGTRSTYALFVPTDAMQPGCGGPGRVIDVRVAGVAAATALWTPNAIALDLAASSGE